MKSASTPQYVDSRMNQEPWIEKRMGFENMQRPAKLADFEADKSLGKGMPIN